jgi:hypothetical protein
MIRLRPTHTITVRITQADYRRLREHAQHEEMPLTHLIRSYLSTGLRAEQQAPLAPVRQYVRPKRG